LTQSSQQPSKYSLLATEIAKLQRDGGIDNPQASDVMTFAPHLSPGDAVTLLERAKHGPVTFCGPPMRVRGALQIYEIRHTTETGSAIISGLRLRRLYAARRRISHQFTTTPRANFREWPNQEAAEDYAAQNWNESMIWDESRSVMRAYLVHPREGDRIERLVGGLVAHMTHPFPEVLQGDYKPECELLDERILAADHWFAACDEMLGRHQPFAAFYCADCGGTIDDDKCSFCLAPFSKAAAVGRGGWFSAMPYRLATLVEEATEHQFSVSPIESRKADYREWSTPNFIPTANEECNLRMISFETPST